MLFKCSPMAAVNEHSHGHGAVASNGGKHLKVDIHCHLHVPEADKMLQQQDGQDMSKLYMASNELTADINTQLHQEILPQLTDPTVRLADMDRCGIDVQAISPAPFHYNYHHDAEFARETSRVVNDRVAEVVATNTDRFVGMCTVPLQNSDMAVAELERCVKEHGMRGVEISTNVNGKELTRAGLEPFFSKVV
jgi:aminocarboxymuconate-semialdehyde decarboxylase